MTPIDDPPAGADGPHTGSLPAPDADERLSLLERQVSELTAEVSELRSVLARGATRPATATGGEGFVSPAMAAALRRPPRPEGSAAPPPPNGPTFTDRMHSTAAISGDEIESLVGRYGTLALAALVILMGVGAVIKMAVQYGMLTPEVRVVGGVVVAAIFAVAGFIFRGRGEVRYGGVLLALSLAVIDLVAWGAGPRFHLVPISVALGAVDVAAIALAALALHDESEFLFSVAVAGALSAPFVTSTGGGTALALLLYGGVGLAGALRSARDPEWTRAFGVLVGGALVYALSAAALPISAEWYGAYLVALFGGACATAALLFGEPEWRGELPRAYLAVTAIGVIAGWDAVASRAVPLTIGIAGALAAVTYAALAVRRVPTRVWPASALVLPLVSLGVAYPGAASAGLEGAAFAVWTVFAFGAWWMERRHADAERAGMHLLAAALLGSFAITAWAWSTPLMLVGGLAAWGAVVALVARDEETLPPVIGVALIEAAAALSAFDQLSSRSAYSYTPFVTRSSASAATASIGVALAGAALSRGRAGRYADRPVRLGSLIGCLIVWGRMEVANAFSPDVSAFLLSSYYAACGVASILAGRRLGIRRLRIAGLALALYAAFKAIVEVTDIKSVLLRVGAYAAVGVFLLGAGYLYREAMSHFGDRPASANTSGGSSPDL